MSEQLLHLVFGGELADISDITFKDLDEVEMVGIYPSYAKAYDAWKAASHSSVDHAKMRYFIVHLHRLMSPEEPE